MTNRPTLPDSFVLRPLEPRDHAAVLAINAACQPAVAPLEPADLADLVARHGRHWVAADAHTASVAGYLLTFDSEENSYDDEEIQVFRAQVDRPFVYIAQVALAPAHRRVGLGRAFYETVFAVARTHRRPRLCADVNLRPANEASLHFHLHFGFKPIGEMETSIGYRIALLTLHTPRPNQA